MRRIVTKTRARFAGRLSVARSCWSFESNCAPSRIQAFSTAIKDISSEEADHILEHHEKDETRGASFATAREEALPVTFSDISRANVAIRSGIKRTTCEQSYFLSELIGANVFLKTEFRQFTGSFKERGARNALFHHLRRGEHEFKQMGAIAASAGNHALALAYHGQQLGIPITVVMPTVAPLAKVDRCRKFGAKVIIEGGELVYT